MKCTIAGIITITFILTQGTQAFATQNLRQKNEGEASASGLMLALASAGGQLVQPVLAAARGTAPGAEVVEDSAVGVTEAGATGWFSRKKQAEQPAKAEPMRGPQPVEIAQPATTEPVVEAVDIIPRLLHDIMKGRQINIGSVPIEGLRKTTKKDGYKLEISVTFPGGKPRIDISVSTIDGRPVSNNAITEIVKYGVRVDCTNAPVPILTEYKKFEKVDRTLSATFTLDIAKAWSSAIFMIGIDAPSSYIPDVEEILITPQPVKWSEALEAVFNLIQESGKQAMFEYWHPVVGASEWKKEETLFRPHGGDVPRFSGNLEERLEFKDKTWEPAQQAIKQTLQSGFNLAGFEVTHIRIKAGPDIIRMNAVLASANGRTEKIEAILEHYPNAGRYNIAIGDYFVVQGRDGNIFVYGLGKNDSTEIPYRVFTSEELKVMAESKKALVIERNEWKRNNLANILRNVMRFKVSEAASLQEAEAKYKVSKADFALIVDNTHKTARKGIEIFGVKYTYSIVNMSNSLELGWEEQGVDISFKASAVLATQV